MPLTPLRSLLVASLFGAAAFAAGEGGTGSEGGESGGGGGGGDATSRTEESLDRPLARVGGVAVTRRDLLVRLGEKFRTSNEGRSALNEIVDNRLVEREMAARKIVVDEAAVEARFRSLEKMVADSGSGATLTDELADRDVSLAEFKDRLKLLIGLETLARKDFGIESGTEVPTAKQHLWLKSVRERAKVEIPAAAGDRRAAVIDGEAVPIERLGQEVEKAISEERRREALNEAIGILVVSRLSAEAGIAVTDDDVRAEVAARRRQFESDPRFQGVSYEEYLEATRGAGPDAFLADPDFRAQVALKKIVLASGGREAVRKRFEERQDLYGVRVHARHVFVRASEKPLAPPLGDGKTSRTFAEAETIAREAKAELSAGAEWKAVVSKYSEDASRLRDGDLGFFPERNRFGPAFFENARALGPGTTSEPVRTEFGWHLVQTLEVRPAPTVDEAFDRVLADLAGERYREALSAAKVEILPDAPRTGAPGDADRDEDLSDTPH